MDSGRQTRKFPGYTTQDLVERVAQLRKGLTTSQIAPDRVEAMIREIWTRRETEARAKVDAFEARAEREGKHPANYPGFLEAVNDLHKAKRLASL